MTTHYHTLPCCERYGPAFGQTDIGRPAEGEDTEYWGVYGRVDDGTDTWVADFATEQDARDYCALRNTRQKDNKMIDVREIIKQRPLTLAEKAYLLEADLWGANLQGVRGDMRRVKSLQISTYPVAYTSSVMQIGCQNHSLETWWALDDEAIDSMDRGALVWWQKWKPVLQQIIAISPAL
jgi:hypothetical protein